MLQNILVWVLLCSTESHLLLEKRDFLDEALRLQTKAWALDDPAAVRDYVVLITEYHSKSLSYRIFFMKNLLPGDRLAAIRISTDAITMETTGSPVEEQMEELLRLASEKFPKSPDIAFATAQYLFRGREAGLKSKLQLTPGEMLEIFRRARLSGVESAGSLFVLALHALTSNPACPQDAAVFLARANALNPYDEQILFALINDSIETRDFHQAGELSRTLYQTGATTSAKVNGLSGAARAFYGLGSFDDALIAVFAGLDINPRHALLWIVGLDCLRKINDAEAYKSLIANFLDQDPVSPTFFQDYLNYLRQRGRTDNDQAFIAEYAKKTDGEPLVRVARNINLVFYFLQYGRSEEARHFLESARGAAASITQPQQDMAPLFAKLEMRIEAIMPTTKPQSPH